MAQLPSGLCTCDIGVCFLCRGGVQTASLGHLQGPAQDNHVSGQGHVALDLGIGG